MTLDPAEPIRVVLDVNFPVAVRDASSRFTKDIVFVTLDEIDPAMRRLTDRNLVRAIKQEGFDWLVTADPRMLSNPSELAAVMSARISVFAVDGVGHDPLRAMGAVLLDLPGAIARFKNNGRAPLVVRSKPRNPQPISCWEEMKLLAQRRHCDVEALFEEVRVAPDERDRPWRLDTSAS